MPANSGTKRVEIKIPSLRKKEFTSSKQVCKMAIEKVRAYFEQFGIADRIKEFHESSATVELAAHALCTEPCRIAKTLSFMLDDKAILIVTAGDAKIDNHKYKSFFGAKAKMLKPEEVNDLIGHGIGGGFPFGNNDGGPGYP